MLEIRKGTIRDTEPLIDLMVLVRQSMEHKEWLYLDPPDEVRRMMNDGTMSLWVSMDGKRMAGAFDILRPSLAPFNLVTPLGFQTKICKRLFTWIP